MSAIDNEVAILDKELEDGRIDIEEYDDAIMELQRDCRDLGIEF